MLAVLNKGFCERAFRSSKKPDTTYAVIREGNSVFNVWSKRWDLTQLKPGEMAKFQLVIAGQTFGQGKETRQTLEIQDIAVEYLYLEPAPEIPQKGAEK